MIGFLVCLALTVLFCALVPVLARIKNRNCELIPILLAGVSFTACIGFLGVWVCGSLFPRFSPYLAFAIGAALPEIWYVCIATWDRIDRGRPMHGLAGGLILMFGLPCCLLLQLIDLMIWLVRR